MRARLRLGRPYQLSGSSRPSRAGEAGFTLAEIMLSMVVFAVAVVGLVAMERRGVETHMSAMEQREAERIGQEALAELQQYGFNELVQFDFGTGTNPTFPYEASETADMRMPPQSEPNSVSDLPPGARAGFFNVTRRVSLMDDAISPGGDPTLVTGLRFDVWVLWVENNPLYPPPVGTTTASLTPAMFTPGDLAFRPWVRGIHLQSIRVNDAVIEGAAP
jgi:hypothetical protein